MLIASATTTIINIALIQVTGFLIRSKGSDLDVMAIREAEDPHKEDSGAPRYK